MTCLGTPPRVLRRRETQRRSILSLAAERFAAEGPEAVTLEALAEAADLSRGTLYSHFSTKDELVAAVVEPALTATRLALSNLEAEEERELVSALLRKWVTLFHQHRAAMKVGHALGASLPPDLEESHRAVVRRVTQLFSRVARGGALRGTPEWASLLLARLSVPLLETLEAVDPSGEAFVEVAATMLLRPHPSGRI